MGTKLISNDQANQIRDMIRQWARLLAEQLTTPLVYDKSTFVFSGCWSVFKKQFRLKNYRNLPADKFAEAEKFINTQIKQCKNPPTSSPPGAPTTHNHTPVVILSMLPPQSTMQQINELSSQLSRLLNGARTAQSTPASDRDQLRPSAPHDITTDDFDSLPF